MTCLGDLIHFDFFGFQPRVTQMMMELSAVTMVFALIRAVMTMFADATLGGKVCFVMVVLQ